MLSWDQVPVWVEPGVMRPPGVQTPMILVGPGTGVAPFRAFLEDRWAAHMQGSPLSSTFLVHMLFPLRPQTWTPLPCLCTQSSECAEYSKQLKVPKNPYTMT